MKKEILQKIHHGGKGVLLLTIEGKQYEWKLEYITGAEIKQLAGLPMDSEIYLSIQDPWEDELIKNDTKVNLARPEAEHFYCKKKLEYTINGKPFASDKQYVKGSHLKKQGGIPQEDDLFLRVEKPWEDELIDSDEWVDLARPDTEHFYSKEVCKKVTIIVNGTPHEWEEKQISFKEVIILAYGNYVDKPTMVYTVGFEDGPKENPDGSMIKDSSVFVKNKMIFHATATDKS